MSYNEIYKKWIDSDIVDENTKNELLSIKDEKEIEDRFYKDLEFGTGGLRGVIGAGTNRMNIYTVGKATQGLALYLLNNYKDQVSVSIGYDSRNMSKEFAEISSLVLCANGIKVNLFESLRPTPVVSYTTRYLGSKAGIVITASHNPKQYNGYKVYGEDGGQVTDKNAGIILECIESLKDFKDVKKITKSKAIEEGLLNIIGEDVDKTYIEKVKSLAIRKDLISKYSKELNIIYTPIHGSGNIPVRRVLKELGYSNLNVVKEQELPDGNFPTAPYPNPEDPKVFKIAMEMAKSLSPDIIFGTDPDCDRLGVVVKDSKGEYKVLSGNQTGVLLTNYILTSLKEINKMPKNGTIIKTIVTTEMVRNIAKDNNVELIDVLTGFKYIGEKIKEFEENNNKTFIFGFEESFGYLSGTFVRDKDAVIASMLVCEMALYYKKKNMSLYDALIELYNKYGFYKEGLTSIELSGKEGQEKIQKVMQELRDDLKDEIDGIKIAKKMDYKLSVEKDLTNDIETTINLPKSNVLKFILEDGSWFVVRPSGTEPKVKIYSSVVGNSLCDADNKFVKFNNTIMSIINSACGI
ncbi:MAG: phospho-sugar mutase [Bacillota bacterium]|nr:phospho-sugar mutase [Bacillota bacterium]